MSTNDPKDPTTWTPGMIAAFNAVRPSEAQRMTERILVVRDDPPVFERHRRDRIEALEAVAKAAKRVAANPDFLDMANADDTDALALLNAIRALEAGR